MGAHEGAGVRFFARRHPGVGAWKFCPGSSGGRNGVIQGMDYGDRQERALEIIRRCRSRPDRDEVAYIHGDGTRYSYAEIADEIERMTPIGRETLAVAGLVAQALQEN